MSADKRKKFANLDTKNVRQGKAEDMVLGKLDDDITISEIELIKVVDTTSSIVVSTTDEVADMLLENHYISEVEPIEKKKKTNNPDYKRITFILENKTHKRFKRLATDLDSSMVDMLDEALKLYMDIRTNKDLKRQFKSRQTVTEIVNDALVEYIAQNKKASD